MELRLKHGVNNGDQEHILHLPDTWDITIAEPPARQPLSDVEIRRALAKPIGSERIAHLARGAERVLILSDDISRATPVARLITLVLEELSAGGVQRDQVQILIANGTHRMQSRDDFVRKLGNDIVDSFDVTCHDCRNDLVDLGKTSAGKHRKGEKPSPAKSVTPAPPRIVIWSSSMPILWTRT